MKVRSAPVQASPSLLAPRRASLRRRHVAACAAGLLAAAWWPASPAAPVPDTYAAFWQAMQSDNSDELARLLKRGVDPNTVDERGEPALIVALRIGLPRCAALLLKHPALKVDQRNALGETALMLAVYREQADTVNVLLGRGAKVDKDGWTPLHYAADVGALALVQLLAERGARIDARSPNDTTPLMMAARNGNGAVVRWLLARGADRTARNASGWTAETFATKGGFAGVARELAPPR
jgi:hypothetical protein